MTTTTPSSKVIDLQDYLKRNTPSNAYQNPEALDIIFQCNCGSQSFSYHLTGDLECTECGVKTRDHLI